jgi:hypothetical protein
MTEIKSHWRPLLRSYCSIMLIMVSLSTGAGQDKLPALLKKHQYNLNDNGRKFLLREADEASFFLLGELHGSVEVPQLIYSLWPEMNKYGYRHIAAEVSPWAAEKLEFGKGTDTLMTEGLWTNREARLISSTTKNIESPLIWGCDMEEISLDAVIHDLARRNPDVSLFQNWLAMITSGYERKASAALLKTYADQRGLETKHAKQIPYLENIVTSLRIDSARAFDDSKLKARLLRENLMKEIFAVHYRNVQKKESEKILLRFGRNHLHRGFDSRGISTLGNFVSELAIYRGLKTFNVAMFATGGQCRLMGESFDADERTEDAAFQFLWEQAVYDGTIFDLRPLRIELHLMQSQGLSEVQKRLLYWANSYDAIICFKNVTPISGNK